MDNKSRKPFQFGALLKQRMEGLINNQYMSDVSFAVGTRGEMMVAHKFIITVASEVFHTQFNGTFSNSKYERPITLADIEPPIFLETLRFMYVDYANFTVENVVEIYYAAQKYLLTELIKSCEEYIQENIDETNVLKILDKNCKYKFPLINEECLSIIQNNPLACLKGKDFLNLQKRSVELIIQCPTMNCTRKQMSKAIQDWMDGNNSKDGDKLLPEKQTYALQCRRLSFYNTFDYVKGMKVELKFTFGQYVSIYGVGLFIAAKKWTGDEAKDVVSVSVDIESMSVLRRVAEMETIPVKRDLYVYDIFFEKLRILKGTTFTLTVTTFSRDLEIFYLNDVTPVDGSNELNFSLTNYSANGEQSSLLCHKYSHIASLLYNIGF